MPKEMQELQKQWHSIVQSIHSNSNVVAFMNSRVGQYLDDHPFIALSLLMFIAVSAIPVAFFLIFVVTTAIMACIGVIVMEGVVITMGGIALLCVLCGLGALSLGVSGVLSICYVVLSTVVNYWYASRDQIRKQEVNGSLPQKSPPVLDLSDNDGKNE
ncbi:T159A protein, partial [Rissa tridactyla]|nr:lipid droplet assembly factor 1 [Rissa tridactyla]XP_054066965.1 lipid droplet assembly factor 1 [Rissa tridactyla]XP_054066966.1 lipid droplet assembly factor 1 [Rissa tridactyla]NXV31412.1 T159A protein [Rissa tridactyla]